ncbi:hypothetical protein GLAREA_12838 [Glarea lozoyensis ATCC 20868]|uniref:Delta(24(24(1)))-sterol reductase n=1 Tax=Glarea lozoyensis (strain ATCC 20868 / MF5171) TaxID=1116229 RepID=S3CWT0_GLAL2|nr:uncharacterized protein GLAREA_12838 [Glarea lozoyensis ATCC 20868]EPE30115.1 hypothetical protein GLAREA_12838 [Glarea lozoyensis ATCC 20868]
MLEDHPKGDQKLWYSGRDNDETSTLRARAAYNGLSKSPTVGSTDSEKPGAQSALEVDLASHYEFGGPWGVSAMMIFFPLLMYYMWIGATFYDGKLPLPRSQQSITEFVSSLGSLVYEEAFPSFRAWKIYWSFIVFEAACYCLLPGVWSTGKPLHHLGGVQLKYYCSGVWSLWVTIITAGTLHLTGLFKLHTLLDEFGPIMSVAIISGFVVAFIAYFSAIIRGAQHRMSGNFIYDFWMGAELNPRLFGILDLKMFFMLRLPWNILLALSCAAAARQYDQYGYVSAELWFLVMAHFLYTNACAKGEECTTTTWDIYYEKWGFMLIFWNLAGVPLSYCHAILYTANHLSTITSWTYPSLRTLLLTCLFTSYLIVYWIWDTINSQKNNFRAHQAGTFVPRSAFPQLPWQTLKNPKFIKTTTGDNLLVDGWYKYARKIHYTCDVYFAVAWAVLAGFKSPFPWFYPVFFTCMIAHRARRDVRRCEVKYGDSWVEYKKMVPWLFVPYIF